jgi:hypothetical protein
MVALRGIPSSWDGSRSPTKPGPPTGQVRPHVRTVVIIDGGDVSCRCVPRRRREARSPSPRAVAGDQQFRIRMNVSARSPAPWREPNDRDQPLPSEALRHDAGVRWTPCKAGQLSGTWRDHRTGSPRDQATPEPTRGRSANLARVTAVSSGAPVTKLMCFV